MALEYLEPRGFFKFFEEFSAIPHGSRNTKAISDWCVEFAKARGLEYIQDEWYNVIIFAPGTAGYESAPPMIIQGHLDMVCEQTETCTKDMDREGLDLETDGVWVWAKGTTLGADDGTAVAYALAILDDPAIPHPPLEVVLTTEEEIGMLGALDLDVAPLKGRQMINLDSEHEGVFTVGCAGGSMVTCKIPVERDPFASTAVKVKISGLTGGHSGMEIHHGRANASMLMGRILCALERKMELRLVEVTGGTKDNAINTIAEAVCLVEDAAAAMKLVHEMGAAFCTEYHATDPGMTVEVVACSCTKAPLSKEATHRIVCFLTCAPNGVQTMSQDLPGSVESSLNLGILATAEDHVTAVFCVRSNPKTQLDMIHDRLCCLTEYLGGTVDISGVYPTWTYEKSSRLLKCMTEVYRDQHGLEPETIVTHGGLECGILCDKIPGLDCVALGPNEEGAHTPGERMEVASIHRVWDFLLEVLKRSK